MVGYKEPLPEKLSRRRLKIIDRKRISEKSCCFSSYLVPLPPICPEFFSWLTLKISLSITSSRKPFLICFCQCGYKSFCAHITPRIFYHHRGVTGITTYCGYYGCSIGKWKAFLCICPCRGQRWAGRGDTGSVEIDVMVFPPDERVQDWHIRSGAEMNERYKDLELYQLNIAGK